MSDSRLVRRVLGNMLKNALEATEPGGVATLGCRSDENEKVSPYSSGDSPLRVSSSASGIIGSVGSM